MAALACTLIAAFVPLAPKWRDFAGGMAVGLLLALTVSLFRAPQAEVEHLPHETTDQP